jgi:hypothetical protein
MIFWNKYVWGCNVKRSEEIARVLKIKWQAIGILASSFEENLALRLREIEILREELKRITDGTVEDKTITI